MLRYATYRGNVEHVHGEAFVGVYILKAGGSKPVRWVATDAYFNPETGTTRVEFYGEDL